MFCNGLDTLFHMLCAYLNHYFNMKNLFVNTFILSFKDFFRLRINWRPTVCKRNTLFQHVLSCNIGLFYRGKG